MAAASARAPRELPEQDAWELTGELDDQAAQLLALLREHDAVASRWREAIADYQRRLADLERRRGWYRRLLAVALAIAYVGIAVAFSLLAYMAYEADAGGQVLVAGVAAAITSVLGLLFGYVVSRSLNLRRERMAETQRMLEAMMRDWAKHAREAK